MEDFNKELLDFLDEGTCSFTSALEVIDILKKNGYQELKEEEDWDLSNSKYYIIRNDASIIAFNIPESLREQFLIVCTHNDTPSILVKPNSEYYENGYLKLNVAPYGGILNYGFMDRPLGIAGRIILKNKNSYTKKIIDTKKSVAIIPSVAIHQNDTANTRLDLNTDIDLMPIISLDKDYSLEKLLNKEIDLKDELFDYDLYLYNSELAQELNKEFIISPRIDNLTCTYASLKAFINTYSKGINMLTIFNSEEIGSNTRDGADSNFLIDTIKKICKILEFNLTKALQESIIISADNTHAKHPNHKELQDHTNAPGLNSGVLIIREPSGTSNSISTSIFKHTLEKENIPYHYYTTKNDLAGGSTQAGANLKHLSINSLDVGLPMLAMHSSLEVIGNKDSYYLYQAFKAFYQNNYTIYGEKIEFDD